jgi:hypothetical protein
MNLTANNRKQSRLRTQVSITGHLLAACGLGAALLLSPVFAQTTLRRVGSLPGASPPATGPASITS